MVKNGFTLIELLVALAIVAVMLSLVVPNYVGGVTRADEAVLRENLHLMRDAIDKHFADTGRYPGTLDDLVSRKYIRAVPVDPITQSATTWVTIAPKDAALGGVYDVKSGAGAGRDGKAYDTW